MWRMATRLPTPSQLGCSSRRRRSEKEETASSMAWLTVPEAADQLSHLPGAWPSTPRSRWGHHRNQFRNSRYFCAFVRTSDFGAHYVGLGRNGPKRTAIWHRNGAGNNERGALLSVIAWAPSLAA